MSEWRDKEKIIVTSRRRQWLQKSDAQWYWIYKVTKRIQPQKWDELRRTQVWWVVENKPLQGEG